MQQTASVWLLWMPLRKHPSLIAHLSLWRHPHQHCGSCVSQIFPTAKTTSHLLSTLPVLLDCSAKKTITGMCQLLQTYYYLSGNEMLTDIINTPQPLAAGYKICITPTQSSYTLYLHHVLLFTSRQSDNVDLTYQKRYVFTELTPRA